MRPSVSSASSRSFRVPPWDRALRWLRGSIGARLVAVFLGLLLVVQVASFSALHASLASHAHKALPDKLQMGHRVLANLLERQRDALKTGTELLLADAGFRAAAAGNDRSTVAALLARHAARSGATESAWLGPQFDVRVTSGIAPAELSALVARLAAEASLHGRAGEITLLAGQPHQVVLVAMTAQNRSGWLLMGMPLETRLASELQSLAALHLSVLTRTDSDAAWTASLSSLDAARTYSLAAHAWNDWRGPSAPPASVELAGEDHAALAVWLSPPALHAHGGAVLAVVSLSVDDAVRLPRDLQLALLAITLLGLGGFLLGSVLTARRVTTPLRKLAAAADRLGAGDYATPVHGLRRDDELGQLATAFEQMRVSVDYKQAQILQLAHWDSLTGLPNRAQFRDAVHEAIRDAQTATRPGAMVTVIMLDLDRFKHVNDVLGYRFGDLLLTCVAERLSQQSVRGGDLVARLGGDEFAVLLRDGDAELAHIVATRIERAFDAPLSLEEHSVDMGAGIGLACWPQHADNADSLLNRAEVAMYSAKRRSNGPLMYDPALDAASAQTLSLLTELRNAVAEGQLKLYLQPKLALDSGSVVGAEALVRWQHPTRGLVPPAQFVPFAEQTGFIRTLTQWVFEEAARHWQMLRAEGVKVTLSINLSTRDLHDPQLPHKFDALLVKHRVPAEAFCLEITERSIMDDPQRAQATLERLSALGFRLAIDDFGTGYSSLAYLKRLPVDELKIDKSFVIGMQTDADDAKIVRSTIDLAHNLGLSVVAEGVENATVWDMLRELNCDQAQGFHMGRPMAASEFARWSASWLAQRRPQGHQNALMLH